MKATFLLLAATCAVALATSGPHTHKWHKVADKAFLKKQKDILHLFKYVNQPSYYKEHVDVAHSFDMEKAGSFYTKPEVHQYFWHYYKQGFLPKGHVFSVFYQEHLKQAIALFKLFYYAKDYETFYKTAVWARQYVNEGIYVYALSVAVTHRQDTYGIVLPPIYEIYPYYFFNNEVIQKVHEYKQIYGTHKAPAVADKGYKVYANYSGWYLNLNPEQYMGYYTEDVGLNAYYYYFNIYYPFWMDSHEFYYFKNERRGEQYYYFYQQFLARYYLERLSNDFGQIKHYSYDHHFETGYYPSLQYPNGLEFPTRPSNAELYKSYYNGDQSTNYYNYNYTFAYTFVKDYERRIRDAIDLGYVYTHDGKKVNLFEPHGFEVLGNLIEANPSSPNSYYYGALQVFVRYLLGYAYYPLDQYKIAPSALEHFETSIRDPAFYQFYKRIVLYFQKYKNYLPYYKYEELHFQGVKVESVEIDELVTYFDFFDSDLTYATYVNEHEYETEPFKAYAHQYRLNHKPFTYKVHVNADKATEGVVRVFIGPKYDEYGRYLNVSQNYMNFFEIDKFHYSFQAGQNVVTRNSKDFAAVHDRTTYKQLYQHVLNAYEGKEEFVLDGQESFYGFPNRFILPKGTKFGLTYQWYVMVSPYKPYKTQPADNWYYPVSTGYQHYVDAYPLGYPFDRHVNEQYFFVPNSYFKDVVIYHKTDEAVYKTFHLGHYY